MAVKRQRQFGIHSQLLSKALKSEAKHDNDVKVVKKPEDTTGLQPALFSSLRIAYKKKNQKKKQKKQKNTIPKTLHGNTF